MVLRCGSKLWLRLLQAFLLLLEGRLRSSPASSLRLLVSRSALCLGRHLSWQDGLVYGARQDHCLVVAGYCSTPLLEEPSGLLSRSNG